MRAIIHTLIVAALAGTFFYAGFPKVLDPAAFAKAVNNYQLLPDNLVNPVAIYLPWMELVCFLALFHVRTRPAALVWIMIMLVLFIGAQALALMNGVDITCGCFSSAEGSKKVGLQGIMFNVGLMVAALVALLTADE